MIRLLISLVVLVLAIAGGLYFAYGAVAPCAALAVERADRDARGPDTSQMTSTACGIELLQSWRDRAAELIGR